MRFCISCIMLVLLKSEAFLLQFHTFISRSFSTCSQCSGISGSDSFFILQICIGSNMRRRKLRWILNPLESFPILFFIQLFSHLLMWLICNYSYYYVPIDYSFIFSIQFFLRNSYFVSMMPLFNKDEVIVLCLLFPGLPFFNS